MHHAMLTAARAAGSTGRLVIQAALNASDGLTVWRRGRHWAPVDASYGRASGITLHGHRGCCAVNTHIATSVQFLGWHLVLTRTPLLFLSFV